MLNFHWQKDFLNEEVDRALLNGGNPYYPHHFYRKVKAIANIPSAMLSLDDACCGDCPSGSGMTRSFYQIEELNSMCSPITERIQGRAPFGDRARDADFVTIGEDTKKETILVKPKAIKITEKKNKKKKKQEEEEEEEEDESGGGR